MTHRTHRLARLLILGLAALAAGPARAQYVDPYPAYMGRNLLLEGSSFETGRDGFGYSRRMYLAHHQGDGFAFEPPAFDDRPGDAVHGRRSLRIANRTEDLVSIGYHWMPLVPGKSYRISLWARAEKDPGEPAGAMSLTVKLLGKPAAPGVSGALMQESFALTEDWQPHSTSALISPRAGDYVDDLFWLQIFTGPWYSGVPSDSTSRLHGTIWIDAVQVAAVDGNAAYEFPPDEPVEIGAHTEDASGPRPMNLFHDDDPLMLARIEMFSATRSSPVDLGFTLRDSSGVVLDEGAVPGIALDADGAAAATIPLRQLAAPPPSPASPSPPPSTPEDSPAAPGGGLDRLHGRTGIFRLDLTARDPATGEALGTEELILGVIEPERRPPDPESPFGTHLHFLGEGSQNGFSIPGRPHDHILETTLPPGVLFAAARDAGFGWDRDFHFASWAAVEPSPGERVYCDRRLELCEEYGLELLPILGWVSPDWADSGTPGEPMVGWQTPRNLVDPSAWGHFVYDTADRYKDRIQVWEVMNEPYFYYSVAQYHETFLTPAAGALALVSGADLRLAGPGGGILWMKGDPGDSETWNFTERLFRTHAGGLLLDILTEHCYVKKAPPFELGYIQTDRATSLPGRLDDYASEFLGDNAPGSNTAAELWDSESGQVLPTLRSDTRLFARDYRNDWGGSPRFLDEMSGNFSLSCLTAAYLVRAYATELAHGVARFFLHTFYWPVLPAEVGGQRLLEWDGTPNHGYAALAAMMRRLRGADFPGARRIEGDGGGPYGTVRALVFDRPRGPVAVLWDYEEDGSFALLDVAIDPTLVVARDMMGNRLPLAPDGGGGFLLPIDNLPRYLDANGAGIDLDAMAAALEAAASAAGGGGR